MASLDRWPRGGAEGAAGMGGVRLPRQAGSPTATSTTERRWPAVIAHQRHQGDGGPVEHQPGDQPPRQDAEGDAQQAPQRAVLDEQQPGQPGRG
ncbi:hypothetical protein [Nonomuraea dietziae]|uniref:hypothetical protein n=1 Tax=Nonomuraea dietziae TaxID=65515 RepID=UPI0031D016F5